MKNLNVSKMMVSWRFLCCILASLAVIVYLFYFGGILPFLEFAEWVMDLDDIFHDRHAHTLK
ncbi:MAG: hypothetical protein OXN25_19385 [Candidatus Poribacteria bacterium]|nr:hypothetical protein [Candidatus Poribacteria bacterium]